MIVRAYDKANQLILFPEPIELEIVKSHDSPARSLEAIFPCTRAYPELYRIETVHQNKVLFSGMVDETTISHNDTGARYTILARSAGALLLDNECLPRLYINVDLNQLYQDLIAPYGKFTYKTNVGEDAFLNSYQILKGTCSWEAFSNFFRNTGLGTAYIDDNDQVVCSTFRPAVPTHKFSNRLAGTIRYSNIKVTNNRYSPITKFIIRDNSGNYSYSYSNPADLGLTRVRYLIPSVEYTQSPTGGRIDASYRCNRSMLGKLVITVTVPGLSSANLRDYAEADTGYETYTNLIVQQIRHSFSASGMTTTLTLLSRTYF